MMCVTSLSRAVLNQSQFCTARDTCQHLETFLVVITGKGVTIAIKWVEAGVAGKQSIIFRRAPTHPQELSGAKRQ